MLRPLIEYCNVIYNSMLSVEQSDRLESLQRKALRIIYGFDKDYNTLMEVAGVETLKKRRDDASLKFATKLVNSDRFCNMFPLNYQHNFNTRKRKKYQGTQRKLNIMKGEKRKASLGASCKCGEEKVVRLDISIFVSRP